MKAIVGGIVFIVALAMLAACLVSVVVWYFGDPPPQGTQVIGQAVTAATQVNQAETAVRGEIGLWPQVVLHSQELFFLREPMTAIQGSTPPQQKLLSAFEQRSRAEAGIQSLVDAINSQNAVAGLTNGDFPALFEDSGIDWTSYIDWRVGIERFNAEAKAHYDDKKFDACIDACNRWLTETGTSLAGPYRQEVEDRKSKAQAELAWQEIEESRQSIEKSYATLSDEEQLAQLQAQLARLEEFMRQYPSSDRFQKASTEAQKLVLKIDWATIVAPELKMVVTLEAAGQEVPSRHRALLIRALHQFLEEHEGSSRRAECVRIALAQLEGLFDDKVPLAEESNLQVIIMKASLREVEGRFDIERDPHNVWMIEPEKKPFPRSAISGPYFVEDHQRAIALNEERNKLRLRLPSWESEPFKALARKCRDLGFDERAAAADLLAQVVEKFPFPVEARN